MAQLLIIGGGVFGLSTALTASKDHRVTLIDDAHLNSASRGLGRIYRSQYPRQEYERLALAAKVPWETGSYKEYFHKTTKQILQPDGSKVEDSGAAWIEAHAVMLEAVEKAKRRNVVVITDTVSHLLWDGSRCVGAVTREGRSIYADKTLLALGAALPGFLASEERPIDDICEPIVIPWICAELTSEQYEQLKTKPIMVIPGEGEYLPPNRDKKMWVNNPRAARVPDVAALRAVPNHESPYFKETYDLFIQLLPELSSHSAASFSFYYCVDCITPTQDFLIGHVPESEGLYMAGGGSCHAFKFFPVLGDHIMRILSGEVTEYSSLWSCERHRQVKQDLEAGKDAHLLVHGEVRPGRTFPN